MILCKITSNFGQNKSFSVTIKKQMRSKFDFYLKNFSLILRNTQYDKKN